MKCIKLSVCICTVTRTLSFSFSQDDQTWTLCNAVLHVVPTNYIITFLHLYYDSDDLHTKPDDPILRIKFDWELSGGDRRSSRPHSGLRNRIVLNLYYFVPSWKYRRFFSYNVETWSHTGNAVQYLEDIQVLSTWYISYDPLGTCMVLSIGSTEYVYATFYSIWVLALYFL